MAQSSALFALAKIRLKQSKAIGQSDLSRLMDAGSFDEAKQVLVDIGFMPSAEDDYEAYADKYVSEASLALRRYSPDELLSKAVLLQYDAHNLKVLFKARLLNVEPAYLYTCGVIELQKLKHMVVNHQYGHLPPSLAQCMNELERLSVTGIEPYAIDAKIDQALYRELLDILKKVCNPRLSEYIHKKITFLNIIIALRLLKMQKSAELLSEVLLEGALISQKQIVRSYANLHQLAPLLKQVDKTFALAFIRYLNGQISLAHLEMVGDNALLAVFKGLAYAPSDIDNLLLYSIASQRQAAALRLIMAAKSSGVSNDSIRERMRDIYAK